MHRRTKKQLIYGIPPILIALTLISIFFVAQRPEPTCFDNVQNQQETDVDCGGPCQPCLVKKVPLPEVVWQNFFPITPEQGVVAIKLRNKSLTVSANPLRYRITLLGQFGKELYVEEGEAALNPAETLYVVSGNIEINVSSVQQLDVEFLGADWRAGTYYNTQHYALDVQSIETRIVGEGDFVQVSGKVVNTGALEIEDAQVKMVLHDSIGLPLLVAQTRLYDIDPLESRAFRSTIPLRYIDARLIDSRKTDAQASLLF